MVWERIEQKAQERKAVQISQEQEDAQRELTRKQENLRVQREAEQERNDRREHVKRLMEESRIVSHLEVIKNKVIGARKDLIIDLDKAKVTLAWGRYHLTFRGEIVYSSFTKVQDYSYIEVEFRLYDETMKINGDGLSSEQWRNQNETVIDAIADAYLSPKRVNTSEKSDSSYSGGSSSSGECCHS